jgi:hypothetical protein
MAISSPASSLRQASFAIFTMTLFILFAMPGAMAALIVSIALSAMSQQKSEIAWRQFRSHYHASWMVPCVFFAISFLMNQLLKDIGVFEFISRARILDTAWDRVANAMLSGKDISISPYKELYFSGGWRPFYTAAQVGMIAGAVSFGVSLFKLSTRHVLPIHQIHPSELRVMVTGSLAFLVACLLATQFIEFAVLPGARGFISGIAPIVSFIIAWPIALFVAVLAHAFLANQIKKGN